MSPAHLRPEFADATGDAIRVVVEFGVGLQRDDVLRRGSGKPDEVKLLAAGDDLKHFADELLVGRCKFR